MPKSTKQPKLQPVRVGDIATRFGVSLSTAYRIARHHAPPRANDNEPFDLTVGWLEQVERAYLAEKQNPNLAARFALLTAAEIAKEQGDKIIFTDSRQAMEVHETEAGFVIRRKGKRSTRDSTKVFSDRVAAEEYLTTMMIADIGRGLTAEDGWVHQNNVDLWPDELNAEMRALVFLVKLAMDSDLAERIEWGPKQYPSATKAEVR